MSDYHKWKLIYYNNEYLPTNLRYTLSPDQTRFNSIDITTKNEWLNYACVNLHKKYRYRYRIKLIYTNRLYVINDIENLLNFYTNYVINDEITSLPFVYDGYTGIVIEYTKLVQLFKENHIDAKYFNFIFKFHTNTIRVYDHSIFRIRDKQESSNWCANNTKVMIAKREPIILSGRFFNQDVIHLESSLKSETISYIFEQLIILHDTKVKIEKLLDDQKFVKYLTDAEERANFDLERIAYYSYITLKKYHKKSLSDPKLNYNQFRHEHLTKVELDHPGVYQKIINLEQQNKLKRKMSRSSLKIEESTLNQLNIHTSRTPKLHYNPEYKRMRHMFKKYTELFNSTLTKINDKILHNPKIIDFIIYLINTYHLEELRSYYTYVYDLLNGNM